MCTACGHEDPIFGSDGGADLADEYNLQLLANIPLTRRIREESDGGAPLVTAAPDSTEAEAYRQALVAVMKQLKAQEVPVTPTITMAD